MISDDERSEVAERLRELPSTADADGCCTVWDILFALGMKASDTIGFVPTDNAMRLADLIDPTCEMTPQGEGFRCSACGTYHDMSGFEEFPWPRCPECGSRVKGSNSMPLGGEGR